MSKFIILLLTILFLNSCKNDENADSYSESLPDKYEFEGLVNLILTQKDELAYQKFLIHCTTMGIECENEDYVECNRIMKNATRSGTASMNLLACQMGSENFQNSKNFDFNQLDSLQLSSYLDLLKNGIRDNKISAKILIRHISSSTGISESQLLE